MIKTEFENKIKIQGNRYVIIRGFQTTDDELIWVKSFYTPVKIPRWLPDPSFFCT
jgi:hypothetical protein